MRGGQESRGQGVAKVAKVKADVTVWRQTLEWVVRAHTKSGIVSLLSYDLVS